VPLLKTNSPAEEETGNGIVIDDAINRKESKTKICGHLISLGILFTL
jgi:hypothetical protein